MSMRFFSSTVISLVALVLVGCGEQQVEKVEQTTEPVTDAAPVEIQPNLDDPYIWLEEVEGEEALAWAAEQNALSIPRLQGDPRYEEIRNEIEAVLTSDDRIPSPALINGQVYNFWQDDVNVRGVLRRTSLTSYQTDNPQWETVIDIDSLAEVENANWVYKGRTCLHTDPSRCLLRLSDGGKDAVVVREFDLENKNFVDGGFVVAEGKTNVDWLDADTLIIGTDFGADSLTTSGYARTLRLWQRGTDLDTAQQIIEVEREDMGVYFASLMEDDSTYSIVTRRPDFFTEQNWLVTGQGELADIPFPIDVDVRGVFGDQLLALMRSDWSPNDGDIYPAGSLIAMDIEASVAANAATNVSIVLDPSSNDALDAINGIGITSDSIYVSALKDVSGQLMRVQADEDGWDVSPVTLPENGAIQIVSADDYSDTLIVRYQSFLTPQTLYLVAGDAEPVAIKALQPQFDAEPFEVQQRFVASTDGTRIPYYVVHAKDTPLDGSTPTRLTAYGGFEISRTPTYMSAQGQAWLKRGGAYALANIRGGGEYGPEWHQSALLENRYKVYEDFIAVAEDLIDSGITSPEHLGVTGGSNGGLLVTAVMVQRPDLYNAIISAVPLIDMLRYHRLLAGASWMAEYGNPDIPEHFDFIAEYSPYQNVVPGADYPEVFLWTNPKDDRVHPGHARKMAARMMEQGHELIYFENAEGGHGGGANLNQLAQTQAMEVVYLMQQLAD
ncbi:MAG: prolyl oligopeptidase family serine peptidase [Pseudomonadales bacterium]|nr:prolyl oligopeptidase family serine peptidase [Pseudomonadales bacterium]